MASRLFLIVLLLASLAPAQQWHPPTQTKKLSNGLVVVVSEDHSAPTIGWNPRAAPASRTCSST